MPRPMSACVSRHPASAITASNYAAPSTPRPALRVAGLAARVDLLVDQDRGRARGLQRRALVQRPGRTPSPPLARRSPRRSPARCAGPRPSGRAPSATGNQERRARRDERRRAAPREPVGGEGESAAAGCSERGLQRGGPAGPGVPQTRAKSRVGSAANSSPVPLTPVRGVDLGVGGAERAAASARLEEVPVLRVARRGRREGSVRERARQRVAGRPGQRQLERDGVGAGHR